METQDNLQRPERLGGRANAKNPHRNRDANCRASTTAGKKPPGLHILFVHQFICSFQSASQSGLKVRYPLVDGSARRRLWHFFFLLLIACSARLCPAAKDGHENG
jgi:hypothetical protein